MPSPTIVWFREDLRLADNPALSRAVSLGGPVIPIFILDEESPGLRPLGGASRWWLHHSLLALSKALEKAGAPMLLFRGAALPVIRSLVEAIQPAAVLWNRRYGAAERDIDAAVKRELQEQGVSAESFNAALLYEPWTVRGKSGSYLKVFTPFWRAARATGEPDSPLPAPKRIQGATGPTFEKARPVSLQSLALLPHHPDWAGGLRETWRPGEAGASERLSAFLDEGLKGYGTTRDRPDLDATSRLSPYLTFGEVGPRQIWQAAEMVRAAGGPGSDADIAKFQAELGWREFSYNLLFHNPDLATVNFQRRFDDFPWRGEPETLRRWQKGLTGYPIVDAGMRQLWQTGWMHNRVRMIVASFLIKHLLIDWRTGEDWFWDTLVDADPASNAASWQWVAGSGADAAPYYRIFNPITQGEKFDPDGAFVKRFVPELAKLPPNFVHRPWEAPSTVLAASGVTIGGTYPSPVVEHGAARNRALAALENLKPIAN